MACYEVTDYLTALVLCDRFPHGFVALNIDPKQGRFILWCTKTFPNPDRLKTGYRSALQTIRQYDESVQLVFYPTIAEVNANLRRDSAEPRCYGCGEMLSNHKDHAHVIAARPPRVVTPRVPQLRGPRPTRSARHLHHRRVRAR